MTRKDYKLIARALRLAFEEQPSAVDFYVEVVERLSAALAADNSRFDVARFEAACLDGKGLG